MTGDAVTSAVEEDRCVAGGSIAPVDEPSVASVHIVLETAALDTASAAGPAAGFGAGDSCEDTEALPVEDTADAVPLDARK